MLVFPHDAKVIVIADRRRLSDRGRVEPTRAAIRNSGVVCNVHCRMSLVLVMSTQVQPVSDQTR